FRAGARELTADALDSIDIVAGRPKPPPPIGDFSYVEVVGCLAAGPQHRWMLTRASDPAVALPTAAAASSTGKPLGTQSFHLVDAVAYSPAAHAGHKVYVRGLLIRTPVEQRLTISALETLSSSCAN